MKTKITFTLLAAFAACGLANAQTAYTTPVGYTTETLVGNGTFNLVGLTLHGSTVSSSNISGAPAGAVLTVPDGVADALTLGPYLIEFTSGTLAGGQELIASFDAGADTITLANDLSFGLSDGDQFVIRNSATIGSIFGTGADVILSKGDANTADLIYIPDGPGFDVYFHSADSAFGAGSWQRVGGGGVGADTPILYSNSIFVQNKGASVDLVTSGEVKLTPSIVGTQETFTYASSVYPVDVTLDSSGLADSVGFKKGDSNTGDLIFIADSLNPGSYNSYFHSEDSVFGSGSWNQVGGGAAGSAPVSSGFIILRRAVDPYNAGVAVPATYPTP